MTANNIVCDASVTTNKRDWLQSRSTLKQKIEQLRSQLKELKQIRKYLSKKRPKNRKNKAAAKAFKPRLDNTYPLIEEAETCICDSKKDMNEIKAEQKAEREARRMERKLDKLRRKEHKRLKLEKKSKRKFKRHEHCKIDVKMNCFR